MVYQGSLFLEEVLVVVNWKVKNPVFAALTCLQGAQDNTEASASSEYRSFPPQLLMGFSLYILQICWFSKKKKNVSNFDFARDS